MFNNEYILSELEKRLDGAFANPIKPQPRENVPKEPCLPARLPSTRRLIVQGAITAEIFEELKKQRPVHAGDSFL